MFFKRRFLSLILALFLLAGLTSCGGPPEDAGSGPSASDLGQERSRATSQKIPPFPSSGASWMRADISVALLSWGTSQTVIRKLSPVSSVRQGIWRTTPF